MRRIRKFAYDMDVENKDFVTAKNLITYMDIMNEFETYLFEMAIETVSEEMQKRINEAIMQSKADDVARYPQDKWTSMGAGDIVLDCKNLVIEVSTDGIEYSIDGMFADANQPDKLEADFRIPVELPELDKQVKTMFLRFIEKAYFG